MTRVLFTAFVALTLILAAACRGDECGPMDRKTRCPRTNIEEVR